MAAPALELISETVPRETTPARDGAHLCSHCRHETRGPFCGHCGAPRSEARLPRCTGCGHERRGKFCTRCGKAARPTTPSPAPPSPVSTTAVPMPSRPPDERPRRQARVALHTPGAHLPDPILAPDIFRQLYVGLGLPPGRDSVIGLTSAIKGEGCTTCAAGLACTVAADQDAPVLLMELDLERPAFASLLGLAAAPGLADVLRGTCLLEDILQPVADNLLVVTAGVAGGEPARLLQRFPARLPTPELHRVAGTVILDLPPLLNAGYAAGAAAVADALVLVVRAGVTPVELVMEAVARLGNRPPHGVILNAFQTSAPKWLPLRHS